MLGQFHFPLFLHIVIARIIICLFHFFKISHNFLLCEYVDFKFDFNRSF